MIVIFLFSAVVIFFASLGQDIFQVFSFILSKQNLQSSSPKILEDQSGLLDVCVNGDGIIIEELGIDSYLGYIDTLKTVSREIDDILGKIIYNEEKATNNQDFVYDELISEIETKKTANDFDLLGNVDSNNEAKKKS